MPVLAKMQSISTKPCSAYGPLVLCSLYFLPWVTTWCEVETGRKAGGHTQCTSPDTQYPCRHLSYSSCKLMHCRWNLEHHIWGMAGSPFASPTSLDLNLGKLQNWQTVTLTHSLPLGCSDVSKCLRSNLLSRSCARSTPRHAKAQQCLFPLHGRALP